MKGKYVKLDKLTVLELIGRIFQAERAVACLSEFHWLGLLRYYDPGKVADLREFIARMRTLLPSEAAPIESASPPPYFRSDAWVRWWHRLWFAVAGPFLVYCWPLLNGRRSRWAFPCQELAYMLNRLQAFLQLLRLPAMPADQTVIALRMDLQECRGLIEYRCDGLRELRKVFSLEYFNKTDWLEAIPLATIIKPPMQSAA
jgi:hypothetical protein